MVRCLNQAQTNGLLVQIACIVLEENAEKFPCVEISDPTDEKGEVDPLRLEKYDWFLLDCFWRTKAGVPEFDNLRSYDHPFWECLGEPVGHVLLGDSSVDHYAKALAEYYIEFCDKYSLPLPSDFAESEEDVNDLEHYKEVFGHFIEEWREAAIEQIVARINTVR